MDAGCRVHLVNTSQVKQYEGLKYADDRHNSRWLARLLCLGTLPEGSIYPKEGKPLRDLLCRRAFLMKKKASLLISMGGAFLCCTGIRVKADAMKWLPLSPKTHKFR